MKIKARRGVCIGVDRHLQAGDEADLDQAQVTFLVGIGAVELVKDEPAASAESTKKGGEQEAKAAPEKSGKKDK